ncbi:TetR/AcrR family transcriptional regulator [Streptomyces ortus]|uniref:TetR/AcrR family transcriptional regulator n=1 Tax=Streptomyces ortus TaxID=2867268 RepID=A0ABT3V2W8_9ACTN|nr:TetR/AcrR family transcriptional regulator [Streptomyces ortus]MCX4233269.1 TetR/AcrR family transcriptional regulator [Streptomyces ortus]
MRNRTRILAAAQEVLVEQGWEAPLDEIARRAGVGNATLYRHFPVRDALLAEAIERIVVNVADAAEEVAAKDDDPCVALRHFLETAAHERLAALCCLSEEKAGVRPELARQKGRMMQAAQTLLNRAQQTQQVRADMSLEEIIMAVAQLGRPLPGTSWSATDQFGPRILRLYLDGLLASAPA